MRFSLIDRITTLQAGEQITAVKNLSLAEEYLQDHFPGFPIMPGVLMVEALTQSGAWLMRYTEDFAYSTILLKQAKAVKFNSFVSPGKTLEIQCRVHSRSENEYTFKAQGTIDGESAISARLTLEQFNPADTEPGLKAADASRVEWLRDEFGVLWSPESSAADAP